MRSDSVRPVEDGRAAPTRAWSFQTRQVADPPGFVRTHGAVVDAGAVPLRAADFAAAADQVRLDPPPDCARGKLAVLSSAGGTAAAVAHQLSDHGTASQVVACSNATAAVAAVCAESAGEAEVEVVVELPWGGFVPVHARLAGTTDERSLTVAQTWDGLEVTVEAEAAVDGHTCARVLGPLNNYLLVRTGPGEQLEEFDLARALRLSSNLGLDDEPLLTRIVIVQPEHDHVRTKFFTCGERLHPSAPLTGLAVLALAAPSLAWFPDVPAVETPLGPMALPYVRTRADGRASVDFPPIFVELDRLDLTQHELS